MSKTFKSANGILQNIVVAMVVLGGYVALEKWSESDSDNAMLGKIVIVDSQKLIGSHIANIEKRFESGEKFSEAQLTNLGTSFGSDYTRIIGEYEAKGFIVIDGKSIISSPSEVNVTQSIADRLGVSISGRDSLTRAP